MISPKTSNHKRAKFVDLTTKGNDIYAELEEKQIPWKTQHASNIKESDLGVTLATRREISHLLSHSRIAKILSREPPPPSFKNWVFLQQRRL